MGFTAELVAELDSVGDWGLLTTDADLVVTGWNRWLEQRSGRPAADVVGRPLLDLFPDLPARKLDLRFREALAGRVVVLSQRFHRYVLLLPPPAGTPFDRMQQSVRLIPLVDQVGVRGTVTVVEDVSERVAYETELRERVEALREADRRKDEFLATLAHELRNPLAPIRNALQIMRLTRDPAAGTQARELIDRQVKHMVRLVDDLLEVSRITRGKVDLSRMRIDVRDVVTAALETSQPLLEAAGHALTVALPPNPVPVDGDLTRLAQVVANLLNNAAKYTPPGGRVVVAVELSGSNAVVRVEDNGLGIPPDMLPRVFDLFTQIDHTLERSQGGLGIGLALVQKLVEMHGGTVAAHSEGTGHGSAFTVRLPLWDGTRGLESRHGPAAPGPRVPAQKRRVLVVDDNVDAADSLAAVLMLSGHDVRTVHDGLTAVATAGAFRPDLVLMDIGMPVLNGYDACRRIRAEPWGAGVRVVALTGWGQEEDRQRAAEAGFDTHLTKPVSPDALAGLLAGG